MNMKQTSVALLMVVFLVLVPEKAKACGAWFLQDVDRRYRVHFLSHSINVKRTKIEGNQKEITAVRIFKKQDDTYSVYQGDWARGKKPVMTFRGGIVYLEEKKVAEVKNGKFTLDEKLYEIHVESFCDKNKRMAYKVSITKEGKEIASGTALPLECESEKNIIKAPKEVQDTCHKKVIEKRLLAYVLWREILQKGKLK